MDTFKQLLETYREYWCDCRSLQWMRDSAPEGLQGEIDRKRQAAEDALRETAEQIAEAMACLSSTEKQILQLRYMELLPGGRLRRWEDIAGLVGYSVPHVLRLHRQAMRRIENR